MEILPLLQSDQDSMARFAVGLVDGREKANGEDESLGMIVIRINQYFGREVIDGRGWPIDRRGYCLKDISRDDATRFLLFANWQIFHWQHAKAVCLRNIENEMRQREREIKAIETRRATLTAAADRFSQDLSNRPTSERMPCKPKKVKTKVKPKEHRKREAPATPVPANARYALVGGELCDLSS